MIQICVEEYYVLECDTVLLEKLFDVLEEYIVPTFM
jgi:hypothetical protein